MGNIFKALLKSLSLGQAITFVFMTAAPYIIGAVVKDATLSAKLVSLAHEIGAVLLVILRKPSIDGGTVKEQISIQKYGE